MSNATSPDTRPCEFGKIPYATRREAEAVREHLARKGQRNEAYKCTFCGLFHIGRSGRPRKNK